MIFAVRRLGPADAEAFRTLRLFALVTAPAAFASSPEEESVLSIETVRTRLPLTGPNAVFGAFADDELVGIAGFVLNEKAKHRHKGLMWGVFVSPRWQGHGLGASLVRAVIAHAADHARVVQASVLMSNEVARKLYRALGFEPYGIERKALQIGGVFHNEELIALELPAAR